MRTPLASRAAAPLTLEPYTRDRVTLCPRRLYSGSEDQTVNVWHPANPTKPMCTIQDAHDKAVTVRGPRCRPPRTCPSVLGSPPAHPHTCAQGLATFPVLSGATQVPHLLTTGMDGRIVVRAIAQATDSCGTRV